MVSVPPTTTAPQQLPLFHTIGREPALLTRMNGSGGGAHAAEQDDIGMRIDDEEDAPAPESAGPGSLFARIHGAPADAHVAPSISDSTLSTSGSAEPARIGADSFSMSASSSPAKGKGKAKVSTPVPAGALSLDHASPSARTDISNVATSAPSTTTLSPAPSTTSVSAVTPAPSVSGVTSDANPPAVLFNLLSKRRQSLAGVHTTLNTKGQAWLAQTQRTRTAGDALAAHVDSIVAQADAAAAQAQRAREEAARSEELAAALRTEANALRAVAEELRGEHQVGVQNAEAVCKYTARLGEWDVATNARESAAEANVRAHLAAAEGARARAAADDAGRADERAELARVKAELEQTKKRMLALQLDKTKLEKANAAVLQAVASLRVPLSDADADNADMDVDGPAASGSGTSQQASSSAFATQQATAAAAPATRKKGRANKEISEHANDGFSQFSPPPSTPTSAPAAAPSIQAQPLGTVWPAQAPPPSHPPVDPRTVLDEEKVTQRVAAYASGLARRGAVPPAPAVDNATPTAAAPDVKPEPESPTLERDASLPPPPPLAPSAPTRPPQAVPTASAAPAASAPVRRPPPPPAQISAQAPSALREPSPIGPQDDAPHAMSPDADAREHVPASATSASPTSAAPPSATHQLPQRPNFRGEPPRRPRSPAHSPTASVPAKRPYTNGDFYDERGPRRRLSPPPAPYRGGNVYRPRSPSPRREWDEREFEHERRRTASSQYYGDMPPAAPNAGPPDAHRSPPPPPPPRHGDSYRPGESGPGPSRRERDTIARREQEAAQYKAALQQRTQARPPSPRRRASPPPPPRAPLPTQYRHERAPAPQERERVPTIQERERALTLQERFDAAPAPVEDARPMLEARISGAGGHAQAAAYHHNGNNPDGGAYRGNGRGRGGGQARGGGAQARGRGGAAAQAQGASYRGRGGGRGRGRSGSPVDDNPSLLNRMQRGA